ncbi:HemK2/MTQ2 family protein methyltransferase [Streptomyces griseofuscus]|uniref:HemK2/MTQ2 family protein methyltransferase n=1 Tax=Streptomyces TaxID=1883 RepID=UPI000B81CA6E|nr:MULTISPECIES: HemK2/MTQ2 family protein methyltransferase [Streptomyces]MBJ7005286.1 methyltransferase [Streptomyces sp. CRPSP2-6A1]MYQ90425.1 methyltransferase [Streptomyces sp. SID4946]MYR83772.1 methyltransferase [Streptomyces sp. SID685]
MSGYSRHVIALLIPGVYAPQDDTALLAEALREEAVPGGARVLDVGTGSGALALAAARRGAEVTAVDVSRRAVWTARLNALLFRLPVRIRRGDLFAPARGRSYDVILANPPYVPAPHGGRGPRGRSRAWDAGHDGRLLLDRICREAPALLAPRGVVLIVQSVLSDPGRTLELLRGAGLKAAVVRRRWIALGPVLRSREEWLRRRGLLAPHERTEELVVIRAERTR